MTKNDFEKQLERIVQETTDDANETETANQENGSFIRGIFKLLILFFTYYVERH